MADVTVVADEDLLARWAAAAVGAGARPGPALDAAGRDLLARWDEPHRAYHDRRHLAEVLERVDALARHARDPGAVRLAAWFHDAVYDVHRPGSEERSARLATAVLGALGVPAAGEVARLVLLTAGHDPADGDADGCVLADADLGVLAADPARYAEYAADVRREHAHVPDAAFAAGRAAVLRGLLAHPRLFRTPTGAHGERAARDNVARELSALAAGAAPRPAAG
ncbi:HD domain-containing protein [Vallicoccus soli]|uniref:Metal-dependent phosphohydrolase n=1 Tax=Vallicoccus soli TaxID=2339232 RepID=A0A3A3Z0J8_9ACTN|nr:metal-dependent phosphohydrolase [Vallicoccus soli]RJK97780.1 metal-dependent phosphohydrolase [Vallicoccus soli]